jgi:hypothetical protein
MRSLDKILAIENEFQEGFKNVDFLLQRNGLNLNKILESYDTLSSRKYSYFSDVPSSRFYEAICGWVSDDATSIKLLFLFDLLIANLHKKVPFSKKKFIKDTLDSFIKSYDSDFIQFLSLLIALDYYLDQSGYLLFSVAAPCNNSNDAEFIVSNLLTGKKYLIQVTNISIQDQLIDSVSDLKNLMKTNLQKKSFEKGDGLEDYFTTLNVPVVWTSLKNLKEIGVILKQSRKKPLFPSEVEPLSWFGIYSDNGVIIKYGAIGSLTMIF